MATVASVRTEVYDGTIDDVLQLSNASDATYRMIVLPIDLNKSACVSIWARAATQEASVAINAFGTTSLALLKTDWQRIEIVIEEPINNYIDITPVTDEIMFFYKCMAESNANKPSDWVVAPEDTEETSDLLAAGITELKSTFTAFNSGFQDIVTIVKGDGENNTGLEADMEEIQSFFKFDVVTDPDPEIFGTPKLTMGTTLSDIKMVLTNKKMSFLLKGEEVAYFSDNKLYVNNVEAIRRLSVGSQDNGGFLDMVTTDNGVGFIWRSTEVALNANN